MTLTITEIENVQIMLEYATDIYSNKNKSDFFYSDNDTDLQCGIYVDNKSGKVTASFRGTTSLKDKLTDIDILSTKFFGKIRVHSGFYDQLFKSVKYYDFYNKFVDIVGSKNPLLDTPYEIYVTGHSLGGALASLFAFKLATTLDRKVNIITFASPKVGNYYWKYAFDRHPNIKNLRVMVSSDPIPLTPIINYYHVAKVLCLYSGKFLWYIEDHSIKTYKKLVEEKKLEIIRYNLPHVPVPKNKFNCKIKW